MSGRKAQAAEWNFSFKGFSCEADLVPPLLSWGEFGAVVKAGPPLRHPSSSGAFGHRRAIQTPRARFYIVVVIAAR